VLVEGVRAAAEALDSGASASFAVVSPALDASTGGRELLRRLRDVEVVEASVADLKLLGDTEHPQGVLLVCDEPATKLEAAIGGRTLLLDAVQDPGNVGTLVRSAVAFGFDGIICLDGTADAWGAKAVRAAAGMTFRIPLVGCDATTAIAAFAAAGVPIYCASAEGPSADMLSRESGVANAVSTFALALGNEGAGVRDEIRAAAETTIGVRMHGGAESLNVGIAGSILMHELTRPDTESTRTDA